MSVQIVKFTILVVLLSCSWANGVDGQERGASYDEYIDSPDYQIGGASYPAVRVLVNSEELECRGFIRRGRTYLPAREALERLGATVVWVQRERAFYAQSAEHGATLRVQVGSPVMRVHRYDANAPFGAGSPVRSVRMLVQPFIAEGMAFVPLRGPVEAIGGTITYDQTARRVSITAPG